MHPRVDASADALPPVTLLWLESTRSGTASELHLAGTLERLRAQGLAVRRVIHSSGGHHTSSIERVLRLTNLIIAGLLAMKGGILLARYHPLLLPVLWLWRRRGGVVVVSVQGALDEVVMDGVPWPRLWARLHRVTLNMADGVITVTDGLADSLRAEMHDRAVPIRVIPNGVHPPGELKERSRGVGHKPYAVFVGNLAKWQGIGAMVAAVDHPDWPPDLVLVIVGDGSQAHLVSNHLSDRLLFLGRRSRSEAMGWLADAVFAFSLQDPTSAAGSGGYWPYKVLEAAAHGVPVITSDAPGLPQLSATLGSTVVCEFGDTEGIVSAAGKLLRDPAYRDELSAKGKRNVRRFFWQRGAADLADLLIEVMETTQAAELQRGRFRGKKSRK